VSKKLKKPCPIDERPEWVMCVLTGRCDIPQGEPGGPRKEAVTWCGRDLRKEGVTYHHYPDLGGVYAPQTHCFVDASHAAVHSEKEGRYVPCPDCVEAIVEALRKQAKIWDGKPAPLEER